MSLVATFGAMYLLGYSIDNISLLGLTLAVGMVVDDAIVMLENIVRRTEAGMAPFEAALAGSREVTGTIISMSMSLVAVFTPILLMGGVVGRVLNEFGVVVTLAILASALVSLTVTPMLAARMAPPRRHSGERPGAFGRVTAFYGRSVGWCLENRMVVLAVFFLTLAASGWLFATLPRSFFPSEDIGQLSISTQARQDISYAAMKQLQMQAAAIVQKNPAVAHVSSFLGGGPGGSTFNHGSMFVQLKPKEERPPLQATLADLRRSVERVAGLHDLHHTESRASASAVVARRANTRWCMQSLDANLARQWSQVLGDAMRGDPAHFVDVASDLQNKALQAHVAVDTDRANSLGISAAALRDTLQAAFGSLVATQIQSTGNSYDVIMESDAAAIDDDQSLGMIRVPTSAGKLVPLASIASITPRIRPSERQPDRPAHLGDAVLQPSGQGFARLGNRADRGTEPAGRHAVLGDAFLRRRRAIVPAGDRQYRTADPGGHRDDLCRPWCPLREFHPPADDSFRPALGRVRSAVGACTLPVTTCRSSR